MYHAYNKPLAVYDWMARNDIKEDFVLVIDADMIMRQAFIPEVRAAATGGGPECRHLYFCGSGTASHPKPPPGSAAAHGHTTLCSFFASLCLSGMVFSYSGEQGRMGCIGQGGCAVAPCQLLALWCGSWGLSAIWKLICTSLPGSPLLQDLGVHPGMALAAFFGYMIGTDNQLALTHVPEIAPRNDTLAGREGRRGDMAGGFTLMHREDMRRVAPLWLKYTEDVRQDPGVSACLWGWDSVGCFVVGAVAGSCVSRLAGGLGGGCYSMLLVIVHNE